MKSELGKFRFLKVTLKVPYILSNYLPTYIFKIYDELIISGCLGTKLVPTEMFVWINLLRLQLADFVQVYAKYIVYFFTGLFKQKFIFPPREGLIFFPCQNWTRFFSVELSHFLLSFLTLYDDSAVPPWILYKWR